MHFLRQLIDFPSSAITTKTHATHTHAHTGARTTHTHTCSVQMVVAAADVLWPKNVEGHVTLRNIHISCVCCAYCVLHFLPSTAFSSPFSHLFTLAHLSNALLDDFLGRVHEKIVPIVGRILAHHLPLAPLATTSHF